MYLFNIVDNHSKNSIRNSDKDSDMISNTQKLDFALKPINLFLKNASCINVKFNVVA